MKHQYRRIYVEWWKIRKSTVYGGVVIILFLSVLGGAGFLLWKNNRLFAGPDEDAAPKDAAQIISFEGDVRIIRASTRETILVTRTIYVFAGDTVQTQADGRAQVRTIDGSILTIRPNSTVVIRDSSSIFGGKNVRVALDAGQLNVKTQELTDTTENVVEVRESENRLYSQTEASFGINPKTNSGEIRISRGSVETNIGGEKTIIKNEEFATVNNGKIASKEKLLAPPALFAPLSSEQIPAANSSGADVTFRWQRTDAITISNFHLQISKSPFFVTDAMILERDSLTTPNFTLGNIAPGTYYWRIRTNASSGQMSDWSEPWKFIIVKQGNNKMLTASDWSVESIGGNLYRISGRTLPGAVVGVSGRETFASSDGSFILQISSTSSESTVIISDEKGNRRSFVLNLKTAKARQL